MVLTVTTGIKRKENTVRKMILQIYGYIVKIKGTGITRHHFHVTTYSRFDKARNIDDSTSVRIFYKQYAIVAQAFRKIY